MTTKIKLSKKEYEIMETIRRTGKYAIDNCQNPTVKNIIAKGLVDFNPSYDGLIFTRLGQKFNL